MKNKKKNWLSIALGCIVGLVNGLFGGGGGMIVVPALTMLLKRDSQISHATAILIILPLSLLSGLFYTTFGNIELNILLPIMLGVTIGGVFGAFLLPKISSNALIIIFSVIMFAAGIKMLLF